MTPVPLQAGIAAALEGVVTDIIGVLPTIIAVLVVLVIGYIVGRVLGDIVTRIATRIGLSRRAPEGASVREGSIERALGKLVAYYVYFVAILAAADILDIEILSTLLSNLGEFLPTILGAVVVLVIGFIVGRVLGGVVADLVGGFALGSYLRGTPLDGLADSEGEFGRIVGMLVEYYVYLITLLAAADVLDFPVLSDLLETFTSYIPALVGGLVILLVGIVVAKFAGNLVREAVEGTAGNVAGVAVQLFIYYVTITLALGAIGFETAILTNTFTVFVTAFLGALAVALAIGVGVGVGLGSKDYVAENVDGWVENARRSVTGEEDSESDAGGD